MNYWTFNTRFVAELTTLPHMITIFDRSQYIVKEGQPDRFTDSVKDILNIRVCVQTHLTAICCKRLAVETLLSLIIIHSLGFGLCLGRNHQKIKKLIFWNYNVSVHVNISALVITYPVQVNICNTDPHNCICILPVGLQAASAHLDCYENAHL